MPASGHAALDGLGYVDVDYGVEEIGLAMLSPEILSPAKRLAIRPRPAEIKRSTRRVEKSSLPG
jgi:hypothetical protein